MTNPRTLAWALVGALSAAAFLQAFVSARHKSLTYDELSYIPAGYSYVRTGDLRLNPEQPPLAKLLAGAALLALDPELPLDDPSWTRAASGTGNTQWDFGRVFLERAGPDVERVVLAARIPTMALGAALVVGVFLLARLLVGTGAGLVAAALCAFDPNLLAHARLATTDLPLTAFSVWTAWAVVRLARRPHAGWVGAAGGLLGLALLSKFSGVLLAAALPLWCVLLATRGGGFAVPERWSRRWGSVGPGRVAFALAAASAVLAVALVTVSFGYLAPGRADLWLRDLGTVYVNAQGGFLSYLAGEFHERPPLHYFLVAFLVKTPLALFLLLGVRVVAGWLGPGDGAVDASTPSATSAVSGSPAGSAPPAGYGSSVALAFLLLPVALFFAVVSWKAQPFGLRYLLPVYPFLFVVAGSVVAAPAFRRRSIRAVVAVGVAWMAGSSLWAHPHYLPYFNGLAGGSARGIEWLDDSNLDWGQDLILLREYLVERGITDARIAPMGLIDIRAYGVPGRQVPPHEAVGALASGSAPAGIYAVSVHLLNRAKLDPSRAVDPLTDLIPDTVLGHTIHVYDMR